MKVCLLDYSGAYNNADDQKAESLEIKLREYDNVFRDLDSMIENLTINEKQMDEEVEKCIKAVMEGKVYFSPSFAPASLALVSEDLKKIKYLTPSEKTILKLVAQQKSSNEIAEELFISIRTVEKHRSNIITKLEFENPTTNTLTNWAYYHKKIIFEL